MFVRDARLIDGRSVDVRVAAHRIVDVRRTGFYDTKYMDREGVIDASGLTLLPGVIDPHVHLNFPLEDDPVELMASETHAALAGGVTTLGHFPLGVQGSIAEDHARLRALIDEHSAVDVIVAYPITQEAHLDEIEGLIAQGVTTFKFFRAYRPPDVYGFSDADDRLLLRTMERLAHAARTHSGVRLSVHCENTDLFAVYRERLLAAEPELGRGVPFTESTWATARPSLVEAESVASLLVMAEFTGCPVRIVHLSSKESLEYVRFFKGRGVDVIAETTPLYLETHDLATGTFTGPLWTRVQPAVKHWDDAEALYRGIRNGTIDVIGTDHCANMKDVYDGKCIWDLGLGGRSIVELSLPLILDAAAHGRVSLHDVERVMCTGGARALGVDGDRGRIEPGLRADLVLCDLELQRTVQADRLVSRSDYTVFEGRRLTGWPVITIKDGRVAFCDSEYSQRTV